MQPWFIWRGVDSRTMGVWVSAQNAPTRASERVNEVTIPGRAGSLTLREGPDCHEGYAKEITITVRSDADFQALTDWLRGDGEVVFSNEPNFAYFAHMAARVRFDRNGNSLKTATLAFWVHPHKGQYPPEPDITLSASGTIHNPGNVAARPVITVTFTGTGKVEIGDQEMTFTDTDTVNATTLVVDCDSEIITKSGAIWDGLYDQEFFTLPPGASTYALTGATAVIRPRWRWC